MVNTTLCFNLALIMLIIKRFSYFLAILCLILIAFVVEAQESPAIDVGITPGDIFSSKPILVPGEQVRLYARITNFGSEDITGYVSFYYYDMKIGTPQLISVYEKPEEVFIDWIVPDDDFSITAKIELTSPPDQNPANDETTAYLVVDPDTDGDGVTDHYDSDDDGDGLSDEDETQGGTDPKRVDTDGDGASDSKDVFPLNPQEWLDTDGDGTGDNEDSDDDNDGVYDFREEESGTNPRIYDTDRDGSSDKLDVFPIDSQKQEPEGKIQIREIKVLDDEFEEPVPVEKKSDILSLFFTPWFLGIAIVVLIFVFFISIRKTKNNSKSEEQ